jgi:hypothetical protein
LEGARLKPKYFTRDRTLSFPTVLTFLLSGVQGAVQAELDQFFAQPEKSCGLGPLGERPGFLQGALQD